VDYIYLEMADKYIRADGNGSYTCSVCWTKNGGMKKLPNKTAVEQHVKSHCHTSVLNTGKEQEELSSKHPEIGTVINNFLLK